VHLENTGCCIIVQQIFKVHWTVSEVPRYQNFQATWWSFEIYASALISENSFDQEVSDGRMFFFAMLKIITVWLFIVATADGSRPWRWGVIQAQPSTRLNPDNCLLDQVLHCSETANDPQKR
jgi:hypothetical protein